MYFVKYLINENYLRVISAIKTGYFFFLSSRLLVRNLSHWLEINVGSARGLDYSCFV